jgi:hypothetical protein
LRSIKELVLETHQMFFSATVCDLEAQKSKAKNVEILQVPVRTCPTKKEKHLTGNCALKFKLSHKVNLAIGTTLTH